MAKAKKIKSKNKTKTRKTASQDWPSKRNVLFRPDRMNYVRKLIKTDGCVFCRAAQEKISVETLCLFQTRHSMVVLNKYPYNSGHILVLPKKHCGDLLQLSTDEWQDLSSLLRTAMAVVQDIYAPAGFNAGLNHGSVAGAGIPDHLHFHLVPRWSGDLNFFPLIAETKLVIENLETSYERLREGFLRQESQV